MNFVLKEIQRHLAPGNTANPTVGEERDVTTKRSWWEALRPAPKEAMQHAFTRWVPCPPPVTDTTLPLGPVGLRPPANQWHRHRRLNGKQAWCLTPSKGCTGVSTSLPSSWGYSEWDFFKGSSSITSFHFCDQSHYFKVNRKCNKLSLQCQQQHNVLLLFCGERKNRDGKTAVYTSSKISDSFQLFIIRYKSYLRLPYSKERNSQPVDH